jgi:hypothetical protein
MTKTSRGARVLALVFATSIAACGSSSSKSPGGGSCAQLLACCQATSAQYKTACMAAYDSTMPQEVGCKAAYEGLAPMYCPGLAGGGATGGVSGATGGVSGATGGVSGATGGVSGATGGVPGATGGVPGATGGVGGAAPAAGLQQLSTAICSYFQTCCTAAAFPATNIQGCESQYETYYAALSAGIADKSVTVDQTQLTACMAAAKGACTLDGANALYDGCTKAFVGTRAAGASCRWNLECAPANPPLVCWKTLASGSSQEPATGVCTPAAVGEADAQTCAGTTQTDDQFLSRDSTAAAPASIILCSSADHLECLVTGGVASCQPERGEGFPCADSRFCASGFYCTQIDTGMCTATKAVGQPCQSDFECQSGACVASQCSANPASQSTCQSLFQN